MSEPTVTDAAEAEAVPTDDAAAVADDDLTPAEETEAILADPDTMNAIAEGDEKPAAKFHPDIFETVLAEYPEWSTVVADPPGLPVYTTGVPAYEQCRPVPAGLVEAMLDDWYRTAWQRTFYPEPAKAAA